MPGEPELLEISASPYRGLRYAESDVCSPVLQAIGMGEKKGQHHWEGLKLPFHRPPAEP